MPLVLEFIVFLVILLGSWALSKSAPIKAGFKEGKDKSAMFNTRTM